MRIFSENNTRHRISILREIPVRLEYCHGSPAAAYYSDGTTSLIGCIGCNNPRCMHFGSDEIKCNEVAKFPYDQSTSTCPVDAISWNNDTDTPVIDNVKCISCGICIRRCPVGALYFDGDVKVNSAISEKQIDGTPSDNDAEKEVLQIQNAQIKRLDSLSKSGSLISESDGLFQSIYEKLQRIGNNAHNTVVRNLLISLGCHSAMRRIGDVYTRMDAVYSSPDNCFGAVEVEFGRETLDASRGVLDDVAVLFTRYGIEKDANLPLVVCLQLPNARQGYWQVVKDIKNVEGMHIGTLSIGSLMLLNWNGCLLVPDDVTYYIDYDNMSLRNTIEWQIGRALNVSEKLLGIFEPEK